MSKVLCQTTLQLRMPAWTDPDAIQLALDGEPLPCSFAAEDQKGYCSLVRAFRHGKGVDMLMILASEQLIAEWSLLKADLVLSRDARRRDQCRTAGQRLDIKLPMQPRVETLQVQCNVAYRQLLLLCALLFAAALHGRAACMSLQVGNFATCIRVSSARLWPWDCRMRGRCSRRSSP